MNHNTYPQGTGLVTKGVMNSIWINEINTRAEISHQGVAIEQYLKFSGWKCSEETKLYSLLLLETASQKNSAQSFHVFGQTLLTIYLLTLNTPQWT